MARRLLNTTAFAQTVRKQQKNELDASNCGEELQNQANWCEEAQKWLPTHLKTPPMLKTLQRSETRSRKVEERSRKVEERSRKVEQRSRKVEERSRKVEERSRKVEERSRKVEERPRVARRVGGRRKRRNWGSATSLTREKCRVG